MVRHPADLDRTAVTAIIPAGNEAHQIADAIKSVLWADEVLVVVDAASVDDTAGVAASVDPKVKILVHEYGYSAAQKNWAIPQASHPYVFLLDADERATPDIEREIGETLQGDSICDAYWIPRRNLYFGRLMKHGGMQTDKVIRLFKRECRYQDRRVHAEIEGWTTVGFMRSALLHNTFRDWGHYLRKLDVYTTWGAEQDLKDGKRSGFLHVALRPAGRFLKQYVFRLGFMDGIPGAISAYLGVYGVFLKYAKLWDLQRRSDRSRI